MSLFDARDWWNTKCGNDETFGPSSLCVSNIDNSDDNSDKIIVGSYNGLLRIYNAVYGVEKGGLRSFQANDLLLETDLQQPILQVADGFLLSASNSLHLAVLHPKKLSVFSISGTAGVAEYGLAYNMLLIYEHSLPRSAFNLVIGPFGQVKGRDFICVQSLDGTLSFYEQESFAFRRYLPNYLLPTPIVYLTTSDSFIVHSHSWHIDSYRYQVLAISKSDDTSEKRSTSPSKTVKRKATADWSLSIGEPVIDIQTVNDRKTSLIIVLGERTFFVIRDTGTVVCQKRHNYTPTSMHCYLGDNRDQLMILIACESRTLLIYGHNILRWSSQLPFLPIALCRSTISGIRGTLTLLSDDGQLALCYLGTNPSIKVVPLSVNTSINIDYGDAERELQQLRRHINHHQTSSNINNDIVKSIITVNISDLKIEQNVCTVSVTLSSDVNCGQIHCTLCPPVPIIAHGESVFNIGNLTANGTKQFDAQFTYNESMLPRDLKVVILLSYTVSNGCTKIERKQFDLPLSLICRPIVYDRKETPLRLAFDFCTNEAIELNSIIDDLASLVDVDTIMVSFNNTTPVSIIVTSKTPTTKMRLRSEQFDGLIFIGNIIFERCLIRYNTIQLENCPIDKSELFGDIYHKLIDQRCEMRRQYSIAQDMLNLLTNQFRAVEKRLLIKLKDRNPTPMENLDMLLGTMHRKIMSQIVEVMKIRDELEKLSNTLSTSTKFLLNVLLVKGNLNQGEREILRSSLICDVETNDEEGWEERLESSLTTLISSSSHDPTRKARQLAAPSSASNLHTLINTLISRVINGESLTSNAGIANNQRANQEQRNDWSKEPIVEEDDSYYPNENKATVV